MSNKNGSEAAFPCNLIDGEFLQDNSGQITGLKKIKSKGLTKREHIAAMTMQGLLASGKYTEGILYNPILGELSVKISDELLKALEE